MDYLSFRHRKQHFAVPIDTVRFIAAENALTPTQVATGNSHQFAMVEYDGRACVILSLARLLNQSSEGAQNRELLALLDAREQDHISWLEKLRQALQTGQPFAGQRDPKLCAFGLWINDFHTDNQQLESLLQRFHEPHHRLHALASELLDQAEKGQAEQALATLAEHEFSTLVRLRNLFQDARTMITSQVRPTVIMLQVSPEQILGLKVDDVGEVFACTPGQTDDQQQDYMPGFGRRWLKGVRLGQQDVTIMEINPSRLLLSAAN
ncbi:CZB domain-containing protein [Thalassolituus sp. LLYu03]|uniref:CZB domain-containing protein n=1 Tax=Thalassolituus sp. LLYu03 TaxID=3421656 RepID=UPI003D298388